MRVTIWARALSTHDSRIENNLTEKAGGGVGGGIRASYVENVGSFNVQGLVLATLLSAGLQGTASSIDFKCM